MEFWLGEEQLQLSELIKRNAVVSLEDRIETISSIMYYP